MGGFFLSDGNSKRFLSVRRIKIRPVFYRGDKKPLGLRPGFGEKRLKSGFLAFNSIKAAIFCPLNFRIVTG